MMKHSAVIIAVLVLGLVLSGCAQTQKKIDANAQSVQYLDTAMKGLNYKMNSLESKIKNLEDSAGELEDIREEIMRLNSDKQVLINRVVDVEEKFESTADLKKSSVRIKVLSGGGKLFSAKRMAKRLETFGYAVQKTAKAPRRNYETDKVFYDPAFRVEAEDIAKKLGGGTVVRPLTWNSQFNIIVVTRK
jgi:outer membrane murein-binding lipoprotein Lpp